MLAQDMIQLEQYMDFLRNRTFRQTLLCHASQVVDRSLDPGHVETLYFSSPMRLCRMNGSDGTVTGSTRFCHGETRIETADPLIAAARSPNW